MLGTPMVIAASFRRAHSPMRSHGHFSSEETHLDSGRRIWGFLYGVASPEAARGRAGRRSHAGSARELLPIHAHAPRGCRERDVSVTDIVQPLRKMLRRTRLAIAEIEEIDLAQQQVRILHSGLGRTYDIGYDQL